MNLDQIADLARLSEDALRSAALDADPAEADSLTNRASERASQVEQLRAFGRPRGTTAAALLPSPHALQFVADADAALWAACTEALDDPHLDPAARVLLDRIAASCRRPGATDRATGGWSER
jgi:hypothetical protein